MSYGEGKFSYELVQDWAKSPADWHFLDASGLFVDKDDKVYVLCRGPHPVMVFDRDGKFIKAFGEGRFNRPHSIWVGPDGAVYCTDDYAFKLLKFSPDGDLLFSLDDFVRPNGISLLANGDLLVSDGEIYEGNGETERVLRLAPDGTRKGSWGKGGKAHGEFAFPHSIWIDKQDYSWVGDRENNRVQIFDAKGAFVRELTDVQRPNALALDNQGNVYIAEHPSRISVFSNDGKLLARWGSDPKKKETGLFSTPHSIAVDSHGDIYVGENRHALAEKDRPTRAVQKFVRKH